MFRQILRRKNIANIDSLLITFLIMTIINPLYIFDIGFELSFFITFSLLMSTEYIKKSKNKLQSSLKISVISFLASMPILISNFYTVPYISVLSNIILVPIFSIIIFPLVVCSYIVFLLSTTIFNILCKPLLNLVFYIFDEIQSILLRVQPIRIGKQNIYVIIAIYLIILFILICLNKNKYKVSLCGLVTIVSFLAVNNTFNSSKDLFEKLEIGKSQVYYLKENGAYVTGTYNIKGKDYTFQSNGKWIADQSLHYKVKPITAYIYSASGTRLSYINQGSIVTVTGSETQSGRIPVQVSGLSGYMNKSDLTAVSASNEFIPHYTSDGRYVYHELSPYTSIRVAPHHSSMSVGKKYYSADGINFDNFSINNPFQFRDLSKPTNYTAEELDKVYSLMNIKGSRLAGKGAIFKEAERRYQINALYLMAHSALESSWGRSQIAKDKNNFFGIAAYDSTPYHSAKSFDNVDKGILGAAKWIRENYLDEGRTHLGNKSSGMNVLYASDPYWGEKIASIMMTINSRLGDKD